MTDAVRYVAKNMRLDLRLIAEMIPAGAKVLDIGSGDGSLIEHLFRTKQCDARGIEIDMAEVTHSVAHGLPVMAALTMLCCRAPCRRSSARAK
jgi:2-polyprenyl-3-methyl-5-hydroxy-6-metoxy-1,4-benzoquinol methylase